MNLASVLQAIKSAFSDDSETEFGSSVANGVPDVLSLNNPASVDTQFWASLDHDDSEF